MKIELTTDEFNKLVKDATINILINDECDNMLECLKKIKRHQII
jgi:hypothetical protein